MTSVDESPCPVCEAPPGCLAIEARMVAAPLGSFSLAGVGLKVPARLRPVLTCSACGLQVVGSFVDDGTAVVFPPPGGSS